MVPSTYHAYFGGCASVAGTLIGLLFVAISVSPHKDTGPRAPLSFHVQSGVAFTTLVDALVIALAALLPGTSLGPASVLLAGSGISAATGMALLSLWRWPGRRQIWGLAVIPMLGGLFILQLLNGIRLLQNPADRGSVHAQALLVIIFFVIGTTRAWQMIGARNTRVLALAGGLVRERSGSPGERRPGPPDRQIRGRRPVESRRRCHSPAALRAGARKSSG